MNKINKFQRTFAIVLRTFKMDFYKSLVSSLLLHGHETQVISNNGNLRNEFIYKS